jgi:5-formyltetrahydrofolate cyclo-ligase
MNNPQSLDKTSLRQRMKAVRRELSAEDRRVWSAKITSSILQLDAVRQAKTVFVYVSYRTEVETHGLVRELLAAGKEVATPKVINSPVMNAVVIDAWEDLQPGAFGILEPADGPAHTGPLDVYITPGLAFTTSGERLGYGQGHYDHFFAHHDVASIIGVAFNAQIVSHVPTDVHDRAMDRVVTEQQTILTDSP